MRAKPPTRAPSVFFSLFSPFFFLFFCFCFRLVFSPHAFSERRDEQIPDGLLVRANASSGYAAGGAFSSSGRRRGSGGGRTTVGNAERASAATTAPARGAGAVGSGRAQLLGLNAAGGPPPRLRLALQGVVREVARQLVRASPRPTQAFFPRTLFRARFARRC